MKPAILFILASAVLATVFLAGCTGSLPFIHPPVAYPVLSPEPGRGDLTTPDYLFRFERGDYTLAFPVDRGIYEAAAAQDKTATIYDESVGEDEWTAGLYRAMILDPAEIPAYDRVLGKFRVIRDEQGLDEDEYLELLASFVQQIPYRTGEDNAPLYPVETLVQGAGDCDDKSILLAGLLGREGYRVSLLYFPGEKHMAVGVGATEGLYGDTGLAYVETTKLSLVGIAVPELEGGTTLTSAPRVIPVSTGGTLYTRCNETGYIWAARNEAIGRMDVAGPELNRTEQDMDELSARIDAMDDILRTLRRGGSISAYNTRVDEYNRLVGEYNAVLEHYRAMAEEYNRAVEVHNVIMSRLYDREGLYRELSSGTGIFQT